VEREVKVPRTMLRQLVKVLGVDVSLREIPVPQFTHVNGQDTGFLNLGYHQLKTYPYLLYN
jgi:hypothetical protein